jgi:hypothetical protein
MEVEPVWFWDLLGNVIGNILIILVSAAIAAVEALLFCLFVGMNLSGMRAHPGNHKVDLGFALVVFVGATVGTAIWIGERLKPAKA